jgi:hypothetical protein
MLDMKSFSIKTRVFALCHSSCSDFVPGTDLGNNGKAVLLGAHLSFVLRLLFLGQSADLESLG